VIARVLVAPEFLYRVEPASSEERPLNGWEVAARLGFFLWSSVPDEELRRAAAAGELTDPDRLAQQVSRMTADPKVRRLATEFFGQWLGFYQFDEFRGVDTTHFAEFTTEVKRAMHQEAVATFDDLSQMNFKFLEGVKGALHLDLTHNGRTAEKEAMYLKTNQFHVAQFAYLLQRMKEVREGDGSLLDHSILLCTSSLFDGDAHSANRLPVVLAGKGHGTLKTGRILDYLERGDENRKICSLHLSLMDRLGVNLDRFGDASTRLVDL
jgi:hypothetical protein